MYTAYVIGTSPNNLLFLRRDADCKVRSVYFGLNDLEPECIMWSFDEAEAILEDLKTNYNQIHVSNISILKGILEGDDFDPNDLHIYQLGAIKEIA